MKLHSSHSHAFKNIICLLATSWSMNLNKIVKKRILEEPEYVIDWFPFTRQSQKLSEFSTISLLYRASESCFWRNKPAPVDLGLCLPNTTILLNLKLTVMLPHDCWMMCSWSGGILKNVLSTPRSNAYKYSQARSRIVGPSNIPAIMLRSVQETTVTELGVLLILNSPHFFCLPVDIIEL